MRNCDVTNTIHYHMTCMIGFYVNLSKEKSVFLFLTLLNAVKN
jgi:hypothetical protein